MKKILIAFILISMTTQSFGFWVMYVNLLSIKDLRSHVKIVDANSQLALSELETRRDLVYSVPEIQTRIKNIPLVGLIKTDVFGNILEYSEAIPQITKISDSKLIDGSISQIMGHEEWEKHKVKLHEIANAGTAGTIMDRVIRLHNKNVKISVSFLPTEHQFIISMKESI